MKGVMSTSDLRARWQQWSDQFIARQRRERAILAAAVIFGGGFLLFSFAVEPGLRQASAALAETQSVRNELTQQQAQLAALKAAPDPDSVNRKRLSEIKAQLTATNERLARFESGMVPPLHMREFLENLLARNRGVELLELKVLAPQPVDVAAGKSVTTAAVASSGAPVEGGGKAAQLPALPSIWQHGIELKLAGSYNDILNYLTDVEGMPQHVMWSKLDLSVEKYPRNLLSLRVYTLSLDRHWLEM
uniref:Putative mannose-sensitive agglutinin (MSHA) biogenesis protein MshJ n=1 Tax=uncultured bacterium UPO42 TaxID=1776967 RepID=A0A126SXW9_9BACT|nr:putative mannose-sensitive agglutinin (MSHA) biogenesis protein MshJ [uncultured bacterium UPO42]